MSAPDVHLNVIPQLEISNIDQDEDEDNAPIPSTVWVLGLMMFLINTSFIMIFGLSAIYMRSSHGVSTAFITQLEGAAEAMSFAVKLFSGVISDYFKRRKLIILIGYGLMVVSKPLMAIAANPMGIFMARFMERTGNGIQGTPRDALVGDIAPHNKRGACYGLKRSLGQAGSVVGGILGFLAMSWCNDYQTVFWLATIPASLGFILLLTKVKEPKENQNARVKEHRRLHFKDIRLLPVGYWLVIMVVGIYMTARVNESMLALHAHDNYGLQARFTPLIMMLYNGTYCLVSYPIGLMSDRISRFGLLCMTMVVLIGSDLFLGLGHTLPMFFVGVAIWGVQMGMAQSLFMALIADMTPKNLRGTSFGIYYLTSAVASLATGAWAGRVADHYGEHTSYLTSAVIAALALGVLMLFLPRIKKCAAESVANHKKEVADSRKDRLVEANAAAASTV